MWGAFVGRANDAGVSLLIAAACRIISTAATYAALAQVSPLSQVSPSLHGPLSGDSFMAAAKQASLVRGLLALLASPAGLLTVSEDSPACVAADRRIAASSDCLSALLGREAGREALVGVMQSAPDLAGMFLRRTTIRLEQVLIDLESIVAVSSVTASLSGSLKCMCLLLGSTAFCGHLAELDWGDSVEATAGREERAGVGGGEAEGGEGGRNTVPVCVSPLKAFSQVNDNLYAWPVLEPVHTVSHDECTIRTRLN